MVLTSELLGQAHAARAAGNAGSARNFRRLVAEVKAAWRAGHYRGLLAAVWIPGDTLVIDWDRPAACTCPAPCWPGRGSGSCGSPPARRPLRRWARWPSASRSSAGCPGRCWPTGWAGHRVSGRSEPHAGQLVDLAADQPRPISGRSDGRSPSSARSVFSRPAGTAQISLCTAALTSAHHVTAIAFAASGPPHPAPPGRSGHVWRS
jgi:hypothetical protein